MKCHRIGLTSKISKTGILGTSEHSHSISNFMHWTSLLDKPYGVGSGQKMLMTGPETLLGYVSSLRKVDTL